MTKYYDEHFVDRTKETLDPVIYRNWKRGKGRRWLLSCFVLLATCIPICFCLRYFGNDIEVSFVFGIFGGAVAIILLRAYLVSRYSCRSCGGRLFFYQCYLVAKDREIYEQSKGELPFNFNKECSRLLECRKCKTFCYLVALDSCET